MMTSGNRAGGFTLIEVLVALTVTSLLLTAVYGIFASISSSREELEVDGESYHEARVFYGRIAREVRSAFWLRGDTSTVFRSGLDDDGRPFLELTTTATSPILPVATGISLVSYRLADNPDNPAGLPQLVRREQTLLPGTEAGSMEHRFSRGVHSLRLRYFDGTDWVDEWNATTRQGLPLQVEIQLVLASADRQLTFLSAVELVRLEASP